MGVAGERGVEWGVGSLGEISVSCIIWIIFVDSVLLCNNDLE